MTRLVIADTSKERLPPGGQIEVSTSATVEIRDELSDGATYSIEVTFDRSLGRFVASSISVNRASEGTELTSRLIREIKVQDVIAEVALDHLVTVWKFDDDGPKARISGTALLESIEPAAGRDREHVAWEAYVISTLAWIANRPPIVTVAESLGISHSTAKRLMSAARDFETRRASQTDG